MSVSPDPARDSTDDLLKLAAESLGGFLLRAEDVELCRDRDGRKVSLGQGGFASVYQGVMHGIDEVAVKVIKKACPGRKELELFLKEVSLMSSLRHRNVVQLYGVCLGPGRLSLVTELMRGGDLYRALREQPERVRWDALGAKVALDVALGLNALHTRRPPLMHRDLKSPNVLLSEEGVAKIADMGMSTSQTGSVVTPQGVMTPIWSAPEVVNKERSSIAADMWSFGLIVWELATGLDITVFPPLAISRQVGAAGPKSLSMPPGSHPVAARIFDLCTQVDPSARPTAAQVVCLLRESLT